MNGAISSVENHGSIVIVWLGLDDGRSAPIYMDHRSFGGIVEGEGAGCIDDLLGRPVLFDGEMIMFLDTLEAT